MARHIIMDMTGHSTIEFDRTAATDLADAERRFNKLVARGFIPAEARGGGRHLVPRKEKRVFDPRSDETIFIPALKGG
jgi:hypothetical protein